MLINTAKTKVMLITTHQKRTSLINGQLSLHLNNDELNMITNDKVLGIKKTIIQHGLNMLIRYAKRLQQIYGFFLGSKST